MGRDLAIDLGSASTLVYRAGEGIVFDEPTVVAVHAHSGKILEMGDRAWEVIDRSPASATVSRPLRSGRITDFDVLHRMFKLIFQRIGMPRFPRPKVLIAVPSTITQVERRALEQAVHSAGARTPILVDASLAGAIGAGLPIHEPVGNLIVDIGGAMTEFAVVSMGGVVDGRATQVGGFDMDAAIQAHVREAYNVMIGEKTAERVKMAIGSAYPTSGRMRGARIRGRETATGGPRDIELSEAEVRGALSVPVRAIAAAARHALSEAPPELTHDVLETGMFLAGGGGLLRGMDMLLAQECEVPVHVTENPRHTVVIGAGTMLEQFDAFATSVQMDRPSFGAP
jgi:rod shape-determining protein MreB and related proteins